MKIHFILHEIFEVPGAYLAWAALSGHDVTMTKVYQNEKLPENADSFDFLIVMGGPQSPIGDNSEFPYFNPKAEIDLIKKAIKADKYIVGVCLGAQLLGEAYGGTTEKSPSCEIGNFPIELTEAGLEDENIKHFGKQAITGHWHSDMPGLPDTAEILAKSKGCPRQIIKYSKKHYGFQCHLEFTKKVAELLINSDKDLEKKSQTLPYVQSPQTIRDYDYNEMNNLLYEFLDNLTKRNNQMQKLKNYKQILNKIKKEKYFLLYVSMNNCSICHADMPKVEKIVNEENFPAYYIEATEIPEAIGQLSLFSVPVVILFYEGREIHRQAKIIDFNELNYRMKQICENK